MVILILGCIGYRTVSERTNEQIKALQNFDPVEFERITGLKVKTKMNEIPIKDVAKNTTSDYEKVEIKEVEKEKTTKKTEKSPSKTTKKTTTKKKATTTTPKVSTNVAEMKSYAHSLVVSYGWTEEDYNAWVQIINHESSWRVNAENKKSKAYGLCQAYPASKMKSFGSDYRTNYKTQLNWCASYIKGRYGSPSSAWSFWQQHHWY